MASVHDVAQFVLQQHGPISVSELLALLYYAQGWSLAWDERPLFDDPIEAWPQGAVVRAVWEQHPTAATVRHHDGDAARLSEPQKQTLRSVIAFYTSFEAGQLCELVRIERPWRLTFAEVRVGSAPPEIAVPLLLQHFAAFRHVTRGKVLPDALRRGRELMLRMSPEELDALYCDDIADDDEVELELARLDS